jgi:hypothetical protein
MIVRNWVSLIMLVGGEEVQVRLMEVGWLLEGGCAVEGLMAGIVRLWFPGAIIILRGALEVGADE